MTEIRARYIVLVLTVIEAIPIFVVVGTVMFGLAMPDIRLKGNGLPWYGAAFLLYFLLLAAGIIVAAFRRAVFHAVAIVFGAGLVWLVIQLWPFWWLGALGLPFVLYYALVAYRAGRSRPEMADESTDPATPDTPAMTSTAPAPEQDR